MTETAIAATLILLGLHKLTGSKLMILLWIVGLIGGFVMYDRAYETYVRQLEAGEIEETANWSGELVDSLVFSIFTGFGVLLLIPGKKTRAEASAKKIDMARRRVLRCKNCRMEIPDHATICPYCRTSNPITFAESFRRVF